MKKLSIFLMMGGMVIGVAPAFADTCSNQTISNKKLHNLEVTTGTCILDNVTVNGGLTVDGGAHLQLSNATVNGGINVQPGGELDLQATTNGGAQPVPGSSRINGGIVLNNALDLDLRNSDINGGVSIAGPGTGGFIPTLCNLDIHGGITVTNARGYLGGIDIGQNVFSISCPGSNIDGSVNIDNSVAFAISNSTIKGSVLCTNGGVVTNHSGNTITGSNTCF